MEDNTGPNLMHVSFADDKLPAFKEGKGSDDWVLFGERNDYPMHLIDLFNRSGKHNAIITGVSDMIRGDGFKSDGGNLNAWIETPNPFEHANDILEKVCLDLKLFGGFCLQIVWSRDGKKIAEIYHVPFEEIRVNDNASKFFRCHKWMLGINRSKVEVLEGFNPLNEGRGKRPQIFYYKQYRPGLKHYPLPDYIGARQYVETDTEISNFHYNNIKHSFSNGTIITFPNGNPTEEEKAVITRKIKGQKTGTDNAGGITVNFVDRAELAPIVTRMQPDEMDKSYLALKETVSDEIFIGHRVTSPMIFGVKTPGQLGGRQELLDAKEMFYTDYIKGKVAIIERAFNYLLEYVAPGSKIIIEKANSQDNAGATNNANSTVPIQQGKQLTEEDILLMFESCGEPESNFRIIKSKRLRFGTEPEEDEEATDNFRIKVFLAQPLNIEIDDAQKKVLNAVKENPQLTEAEISDLTDLSPVEVNKALKYLTDEGVLRINDKAGTIEITDRGLKTIDEKNLITTEIFVKYKYSGPNDDRTRPFCKKILGAARLYSREDIDSISNQAGYNVWTQRGGWYHNPKTDVNTPYCRHTFTQVIVKRKVKST